VDNPVEMPVDNPMLLEPVDKWGSYPQVIHSGGRVIHRSYPQAIADGDAALSHFSTLSTGPTTMTTNSLKSLKREGVEL
jgi:hypothetical protein